MKYKVVFTDLGWYEVNGESQKEAIFVNVHQYEEDTNG